VCSPCQYGDMIQSEVFQRMLTEGLRTTQSTRTACVNSYVSPIAPERQAKVDQWLATRRRSHA
jgi:hypothetical protein